MAEIDMEQFRKSFLDEASELLEQVNEDVLKIEASDDPELVNSVFRSIHTIKGSAAGFGFEHITAFAHHLETLLDKLRNKQIEVSSELIDSILKAADGIYEMVQAAKSRRDYSVDEEGIINELAAYMGGGRVVSPTPTPEQTKKTEERKNTLEYVADADIRSRLRSTSSKGGTAYRADFHFTSEMLENGYDPLPVMSNLKMSSDEYVCISNPALVPNISELNPFEIYMQPEIYLVSELEAADLADFGFEAGVVYVVAVSLEEPPAKAVIENVKSVEKPFKPIKTEYITMEGIDAELLEELASSIEDYFESIEAVTLKLEKEGGGAGIDDLFRVFHTIKGDCGYVGFRFLEEYAHLVESVLDDIRSGRVMFDKKAADIILSVVSDIRVILKGLMTEGRAAVPETFATIKKLTSDLEEMKGSMTVVNEEVKIFIRQLEQFIEIINMASEDGFDLRQILRGASGLKNAAKFIGFDDLYKTADELENCIKDSKSYDSQMASIIRYLEDLKSPPKKLGELLIREGKITEDDIKDALSKQKKIGDILVEDGKLDKTDLEKALKKQEVMKAVSSAVPASEGESAVVRQAQASAQPESSQTMKVDQEKIDKFTNTIGELVVAKNANEYLFQKIAHEYGLPTALLKELKDNANLIARISQDLQRDILSLRMIPIKQVFNKFPRVVRDVARKQNKQIELRIIGEDTEIDKKVADLLSDPLVHLIRNSCDHGIEGADEREKAGKTPSGTIILKAYQEGSFVYIEIIDDGKGINVTKVREKAISNKLISPDADLTEKEIMQLILEPGFSTAEKVTDISGRGVGMDVVKTCVINLGGSVDIQSKMGDGARIVLKIPVTIGVSTALLVKLNMIIYAVPIENVAETIKVAKDKVKDLHYGKAVHYRGMVLPLYSMRELLEEEAAPLPDEVSIVITNSDMGKIGLIVDEFINRIDIAIKPVPEYFSHLSYVGGITILGDGQAVLVLNTNKLI